MKLRVTDYSHQADALIGRLYIDNQLECFTLEDWATGVEHRVERGTYKILLRTEGHTHEDYKKLFPDIHKGMLHVQVPGRLWILIHCGNSPVDTLGCLLLGTSNNTPGKIDQSRNAYRRVYPKIAAAILRGEEVTITYDQIKI